MAATTISGFTAPAAVGNWSFYKGAAFVKENLRKEKGGMVGVFDVEIRRTMTAWGLQANLVLGAVNLLPFGSLTELCSGPHDATGGEAGLRAAPR